MSKTQDVFGPIPTTVLNKPLMQVQDRRPSGSGIFNVKIGYTDMVLNNVLVNEISGASLLANTVTLPAGEYYVKGSYSWALGGTMNIRPFIAVDGARVLQGPQQTTTVNVMLQSVVEGRIVLTQASNITLVAWSDKDALDGGYGFSSGDSEIFNELQIWKLDSNIETPVISDPAMTLARPLLHVQQQEASGVGGGIAGATTWNPRTLNTVLANEISGASLSANAITLPAGTYNLEVKGGVSDVGVARIRVLVDGTPTIWGLNHKADDATGEATVGILNERLVLVATSVITVEHYTHVAKATETGLGQAQSLGIPEIHCDLRIWQLDAVVKKPVVGEVVLESYLAVDATGMTAVTLDCTAYDTFEFHSIDTAFAITLDQMDIGRTVVMNFSNAVAGPPSFVDTIKWTGAIAPEWTVADDTIVLTKFASGIVGAYNLEQS